MTRVDHDLEFLLSLDGSEFRFQHGYRVKLEVRRVEITDGRPHGIKYSLTLHDPAGRRVYGMDNAHQAGRRREFDHRHVYSARKVIGYVYRGPAVLLEDFYHEVEQILKDRGA